MGDGITVGSGRRAVAGGGVAAAVVVLDESVALVADTTIEGDVLEGAVLLDGLQGLVGGVDVVEVDEAVTTLADLLDGVLLDGDIGDVTVLGEDLSEGDLVDRTLHVLRDEADVDLDEVLLGVGDHERVVAVDGELDSEVSTHEDTVVESLDGFVSGSRGLEGDEAVHERLVVVALADSGGLELAIGGEKLVEVFVFAEIRKITDE